MNITLIQEKLIKLIKSFSKQSFIYDLLLAYDLPKSGVTLLRKGNRNMSEIEGEVSWKKKVLFKEVHDADLHLTISNLNGELKHEQRFVIVTDYKTLLAIDTKTQDKLDVDLVDLPKHYDFFLPWAGMEKAKHRNENIADVRAAERMAKLFDEIKKDNPDDSPEFIHGLNVFLSRLLFCFFAEDTNIFEENQFTNALDAHTKVDGSDLAYWFDTFFEVLDTNNSKRKNIPTYLDAFPYVNGRLFTTRHELPVFTRRARQAIIDAGTLKWKDINPDIFGSMFQAVIGADQRGSLGQHYTSVPNIMKVIEPLFLNELYEVFENGKNEPRALKKLLDRISKIKIFDPACGSGNFLIIAYKELRKLEIEVIKQLKILYQIASGFQVNKEQLEMFEIPKAQLSLAASFQVEMFSRIQLNKFYGVEIDDFAHEIAMLSLWLAEHQMNVAFFNEFGKTNPTLPLKEAGHIVQANACRVDWEKVCPKKKDDEIYILGNPPYLGGKTQSKEQKEDMKYAFGDIKKIGELDYIASWFIKAVKYEAYKSAFVTTNSICQGAQVQQLWPLAFKANCEIKFAYKPFPWTNNAKNKAAVIVSIIGIGKKDNSPKILFEGIHSKIVRNISPYLMETNNVIVYQNLKPISNLPRIITGNSPYDGGNLILSNDEMNHLIKEFPSSKRIIKSLYGSQDFINGENRWCLWIKDDDLKEALSIPYISERIDKTLQFRLNGGEVARGLVNRAHKFRYTHEAKENLILVPRVSSERRKYIPFGFLDSDCIISDSAQAIYDPEPYVLGIISSEIHLAWVRVFAGRLKSDFRYSSALCYNTFPFPPISTQRKNEITQCTFRILEEREKHPEKTLAQLYDPDKMPEGLREAHRQNDLAIERCYRSRPFESDEERLEYLFKLYEKMIAEEQEKNTLFAKQKKTTKSKKAKQ